MVFPAQRPPASLDGASMPPDFDGFRDDYRETLDQAVAFSGQDSDFFASVKAEVLEDLARRLVPARGGVRALDVGCGPGALARHLAGRVAQVSGVDVSAGLVEKAKAESAGIDFRTYDGRTLPFDEGSFDLVFTSNVLHHVKPAERPAFLAQLGRVTRPGGLVVVLEHNPLNPLTRHVVNRCPFDVDAELSPLRRTRGLLGGAGLHPAESGYFLFFPFASRWLRAVERRLAWLPAGAQYYCAARRPELPNR